MTQCHGIRIMNALLRGKGFGVQKGPTREGGVTGPMIPLRRASDPASFPFFSQTSTLPAKGRPHFWDPPTIP
ncbi:MAG: hypothetical protein CM15mP89_2350 [Gammaproteobacteria bacterium]|nr:MAG: hypothetical protein CM15mP89_2350 [Gammaproteobacteria bacterium]